MAQELFIHAGAHRTGTSSFQLMLAQNQRRLRERGVLPLYPGRDGAPGGRLRLRLPGPETGPRKRAHFADMTRDELANHFGGAHPKVLLSEENIPGRMFHFYKGQFFPAARVRLEMLSEAVAGQGIPGPKRVVYVVRPYNELFVSAYRKRAEDNAVVPFAEIAPRMVEMQGGWPELVALMRDCLRPETLLVVPYAQRGTSVDLVQHVLGEAVPGLEEPVTRVNLSATDAALAALQARYHAGDVLDRAAWQAVLTEHAEDGAPRGFAAFTEDQSATLRQRYDQDLNRLSELTGITLVE